MLDIIDIDRAPAGNARLLLRRWQVDGPGRSAPSLFPEADALLALV
jgi:hypothetical protein